jgi:hypothetical protein
VGVFRADKQVRSFRNSAERDTVDSAEIHYPVSGISHPDGFHDAARHPGEHSLRD